MSVHNVADEITAAALHDEVFDFSDVGIKADVIAESTSATGVTIDSVLLKDGCVDVNGTTDGIKLDADGDSTIDAATDDNIRIRPNGVTVATFTDTGVTMANTVGNITMGAGTAVTFGTTSKLLMGFGSLAAAGSSISDAGAIARQLVNVTGADGTKGVQLPTPSATGQFHLVYNNSASNLLVYPNHANANINDGADGAAATIATYTMGLFMCVDATTDNQVWSGNEIAKA